MEKRGKFSFDKRTHECIPFFIITKIQGNGHEDIWYNIIGYIANIKCLMPTNPWKAANSRTRWIVCCKLIMKNIDDLLIYGKILSLEQNQKGMLDQCYLVYGCAICFAKIQSILKMYSYIDLYCGQHYFHLISRGRLMHRKYS
jgi:hypothetical protein